MIAIDCRYVREKPSGISPYVQALVDHLPELAPDLEFLFLRHPAASQLSRAPNVREVVYPYEPTGPITMWGMPLTLDLRGVSLFHATFNVMPAGLRTKTVTTVHDVMWVQHPDWCRVPGAWGLVETFYYNHGIRRALERSARIATISEASKREIAKLSPQAGDKTRVTLLGVGSEWRPPMGDEQEIIEKTRSKWVPGARRYVLTVGQFAGYKNHEAVVRAFASAFAGDATTHLVLVQRLGKGSRLLPLIKTLGLEERVHFLKNVPFQDLRALYWGALCLCHPSLAEGFGNPPSEALGAGCPVITSNRSSMPEVSGDAAILVNPESDESIAAALRRVAENPSIAAKMRRDGLERVKRFRWRACAEQTLAIYREVL